MQVRPPPPPPTLLSSNNTFNTQIFGELYIKGDSIVDENIKNIPTPTLNTDIVSKQYTEWKIQDAIDWKQNTKVATISAITLSGEQTIDGISAVTGDRVLVKNQIDGVENGIYNVNSGTWTRSNDLDSGDSAASVSIWVDQGVINADFAFICTNDSGNDVVGTDALVFVIFSNAGGTTIGDGLNLVGNTLSVDNTVIRTTGGQTISGNLDLTGTFTGTTLTDGTISLNSGVFTGVFDVDVTDKTSSSGINQNDTVTIDGTGGNINTQGDITLYNPTQNMIIFRDVGFSEVSLSRSDGVKIDLNTTSFSSTGIVQIGANTTKYWQNVLGFQRFGFDTPSVGFSGESLVGGNYNVNNWIIPELFGPSIGGSGSVRIESSGKIELRKLTITQSTDINTTVSLLSRGGATITTQTATTVAGGSDSFNVTSPISPNNGNTYVTLAGYSGTFVTNGIPVLRATSFSSGSCTITIDNIGTTALNGTLIIYISIM